jgi:hypothetical protein
VDSTPVRAFFDKSFSENDRWARTDESQSGSAQIALAMAQRIDMAGKIEASIK